MKNPHLKDVEQHTEILSKLDTLFELDVADRVIVLNKSLQLIDNKEVNQLIVLPNFEYGAVFRDLNHKIEILTDYLKSHKITTDPINKSKVNMYVQLFFAEKKSEFDSIESYLDNLSLILSNLGIEIYENDEGRNILNHLLKVYGLDRITEIERVVGKNVPISRDSIDLNIFYNHFGEEPNLYTVNPESLYKSYDINALSVFLRRSIPYFDKNNLIHRKWIKYLTKDLTDIDTATLINFNQIHDVPVIEKILKAELKDNFLWELYSKRIFIRNYANDLKDVDIDDAKDFKSLVYKFYGHKNSKLLNLLMKCCFQNGEFNFSYIYLGPVINQLDINKIHEVLETLLKNKSVVNLSRQFFSTEVEDLVTLQKYYPVNRLTSFFSEMDPKFSNIYGFLFTTKSYLSKITPSKRSSTFSNLIEDLKADTEILKITGFDLLQEVMHPNTEAINHTKVLEYEIVMPVKNTDIIKWGVELKNCLIEPHWGVNKVCKGYSMIFALYLDHKVHYCVEISEKRINQFEGKFKVKPSHQLLEALNKILLNQKLITNEH